jgi:site-specific DNA-methyltransferase (adenine-specific)
MEIWMTCDWTVDLMLGDCLEMMGEIEDGSVDLVVTDPPYRVISGGTKSNPSLSKSLGGNNGKIFLHNDIAFDAWLPVVYRKLKSAAHLYVMTNFKNLFDLHRAVTAAGFDVHNLLVWRKQNFVANRWYMKNCEYVLLARKGAAFTINDPSSPTVHDYTNPVGRKLHPTEKPVDLLALYIGNSSAVGDVVLDPFMGSGTTGVAAMNIGRRFIGIERDESYFTIAEQRIMAAKEAADAVQA